MFDGAAPNLCGEQFPQWSKDYVDQVKVYSFTVGLVFIMKIANANSF